MNRFLQPQSRAEKAICPALPVRCRTNLTGPTYPTTLSHPICRSVLAVISPVNPQVTEMAIQRVTEMIPEIVLTAGICKRPVEILPSI